MSDTNTAYCRFCAKSKPYGKLINLETDEYRKREVVNKLSRLSLEVRNLNSPHDAFPKTICMPCIESLDKAFEFVLNVEASQSELDAVGLVNIKQEVLDYYINPIEKKCDAPPFKIEVEINGKVVNHEPEIDSNYETVKENNFNSKSLEKNSMDMVNQKSHGGEEKGNSCLASIVDSMSWNEYSWLCAYCDVMFPCIDELKQHSMQSHGCCNPYRCTDCKLRKLNLDSFIKHVNRHRNNLRLSCYKCHKTFSRQYDTVVHKKDHIVTEFKCPGCNETFENKEQSIKHCSMYNKDKKIREVPPEHLTDDLHCVFCHKQFRYKGGLTTHLLTQHREKQRDHTCDKCGKCFVNKANLAGHMLMHDDIRPYMCEICKHCFRQRSQLSRHMGIHDKKRPFACDQCGRCFRLKKQLSTHSIVHTDKFPHICSYCQKGFKHKSTFIQHERLHTGERPYKCEICHRDFTNWPNYNKHMKRRHGMNMAKSQQSADSLLDSSTSVELNTEQAIDMTLPNKNNFIPKRLGRPKIIKSNVKKKISHESKT